MKKTEPHAANGAPDMPPADGDIQPRHSRLCNVLTLAGLAGIVLWGFAAILMPTGQTDDASAVPEALPPLPEDEGLIAEPEPEPFVMPDMPTAPMPAASDSATTDSVATDSMAPQQTESTTATAPAVGPDSVVRHPAHPADSSRATHPQHTNNGDSLTTQ